jgi:uncharacterized protein YjlB
MRAPETLTFGPHGPVPNNPRFPVLLYRHAIDPAASDPATAFEALFRANGWPPQWRSSVFTYHHYHSKAHEALGVAKGTATLLLGGPDGETVEVAVGDAVVLPAGTGHRRLGSSDDFLVVGAYPPDQADWDLCRDAPSVEMLARIAALPPPHSDPVGGVAGALRHLWRSDATA